MRAPPAVRPLPWLSAGGRSYPLFSQEFVIHNHADIGFCLVLCVLIGLMFEVSDIGAGASARCPASSTTPGLRVCACAWGPGRRVGPPHPPGFVHLCALGLLVSPDTAASLASCPPALPPLLGDPLTLQLSLQPRLNPGLEPMAPSAQRRFLLRPGAKPGRLPDPQALHNYPFPSPSCQLLQGFSSGRDPILPLPT